MLSKSKVDILSIPLNPLADYKSQTEPRTLLKKTRYGDTSLKNDLRDDLKIFSDDTEIAYKEDMGNFLHAKLLDGAGNRDTILSLQGTGLKLLFWILFELRYRREIVEIDPAKVKRRGLSMSPNSLNSAIRALQKNKIIKRVGNKRKAEDYWQFFINPQIMWRGDAKTYYKDILRVHPEYALQGATSPPKQTRSRRT